jgi:hypothetical protein
MSLFHDVFGFDEHELVVPPNDEPVDEPDVDGAENRPIEDDFDYSDNDIYRCL